MTTPIIIPAALALLCSTSAWAGEAPPPDDYQVPYIHYTLKPGETLEQMDRRYRRDFNRARIAGWVLAAADIATTQRCLSSGKCQEGNPIYGKHPSLGKMLAIRVPLEVATDLLLQHIFRRDPETAITAVRVKAGVTGVIVGMNLRF